MSKTKFLARSIFQICPASLALLKSTWTNQLSTPLSSVSRPPQLTSTQPILTPRSNNVSSQTPTPQLPLYIHPSKGTRLKTIFAVLSYKSWNRNEIAVQYGFYGCSVEVCYFLLYCSWAYPLVYVAPTLSTQILQSFFLSKEATTG
jgi:hypothetical protein